MSSNIKPSLRNVKQPRSALVEFFNTVLQLQIEKLEELGNGAAYCQLMDVIYRDMPLNRVIFNPETTIQMEQNYKVLQQHFMRHNLVYNFEPSRLMKFRLQDNLDFAQWCYQLWHSKQATTEGYDPVAIREAVLNSSFSGNVSVPRRVPNPPNVVSTNPARPKVQQQLRQKPVQAFSAIKSRHSRQASGNPPPRPAGALAGQPPAFAKPGMAGETGSADVSKPLLSFNTDIGFVSQMEEVDNEIDDTMDHEDPERDACIKDLVDANQALETEVNGLKSSHEALQNENRGLATNALHYQTHIDELKTANEELTNSLNVLKSERDFYFDTVSRFEARLNEEIQRLASESNRPPGGQSVTTNERAQLVVDLQNALGGISINSGNHDSPTEQGF